MAGVNKTNLKKNVCRSFFEGQLTGKSNRAAYEIPISCFKEDANKIISELRLLIHKLLEMYATTLSKSAYQSVHEIVKKIWKVLKKNDELKAELHRLLCEYGVVELLCEILLEDIFGLGSEARQSPTTACPESRIVDAQYILSIMARVMTDSNANYHHLRWNNHLIEALLSFLTTSNVLRNAASEVLEAALLGTDHPPIHLGQLSGLRTYLEKLTFTQQSSPFFHLLSMFMSDAEYTASSTAMLEKHDHWLAQRSSTAVDANHRFILDIPCFLEGMCGSVRQSCSTNPTLPPMPQPNEFNDISDLFDIMQFLAAHVNVVGGEDDDELTAMDDPFLRQLQLQSRKIFMADIFHIISLLLLGKYRSEVQQRLTECDFFSCLIDPIEKIVWDKLPHVLMEDPIHDDYTTDSMIQIQFLRLVHAIADNHPNRYYLLTATELRELVQSSRERNLDIPPSLVQFDINKAPTGEKGVLSLIVNKLHARDDKSVISFWITRAMEAFLRGETSAAHQLFLINKNVIEKTVGVLVNHGPKHEMVLQGSFDFLSTIMRNNPEAFRRFEAAIDCTAKFIQLVKEVDDHLIDSNMFLRSIILTNYNKRKSGEFGSCRLLDWYSDRDRLLDLIARLIRLLSVPTLSQENVSCLNTSILILYLAEQDNILPSCLRSISEIQDDGQVVMVNFKNLLQFWRSHYTLPTKRMDRKNLELSTGISFSQWCEFVDLLLGTDPVSPRSLRYYIRDKKLSPPSLIRRCRIP